MTDSPIEKQVAANVRGKMIYNHLAVGSSAGTDEYELMTYMMNLRRFAGLLSYFPRSSEA